MEIKSSYEIFESIYSIIQNEISNMINYEDSKNIEEINIKNIVEFILNSLNLDNEIVYGKYYKNMYLSTFKNYDEFMKHYIENTLFIYVLQNNKSNLYKSFLKDYFNNVIESSNGLVNKNPNIFSNFKFYFNIYKMNQTNEKKKLQEKLKTNFIGNEFQNFNILVILYMFTISTENDSELHLNKHFFNMYIHHILEKGHIGEIIKILYNIHIILSFVINNNQLKTYEYLLSVYFGIIQKYENKNNLFNVNSNKAKNELINVFVKANDSILKKINVLSYYKAILYYFTKDELQKKSTDYAEINVMITKFKNKDIIFGYLDLIGYEKYDFNETNYRDKIYILIYLSMNIDYKDGISIYEELMKKDKNKYLISYLDVKQNEFITLLKMHGKIMYIENILNYMLQNEMDYVNKFLTFINESKIENYQVFYEAFKKFIINPDIFQLLNDESHIKLIFILISKKEEVINIYLKNMEKNDYQFSSIHNIMIDVNKCFIKNLYEKNKDLLLYVLKNSENINNHLDKIIIKVCNITIENKDMEFFEILFTQLFKKHNIDLYNGIVAHIKNHEFIHYVKNNELIKNEMKYYINYKKNYLINIDNKEKEFTNCKCVCNICNSFYLDKDNTYKNSEDYNPIFYYCNECNMNIHDDCLFKVMKNHRGKIKDCIFCGSKKVKYMKLSTYEYKYIFYQKLLNNFDFTINVLE